MYQPHLKKLKKKTRPIFIFILLLNYAIVLRSVCVQLVLTEYLSSPTNINIKIMTRGLGWWGGGGGQGT